MTHVNNKNYNILTDSLRRRQSNPLVHTTGWLKPLFDTNTPAETQAN